MHKGQSRSDNRRTEMKISGSRAWSRYPSVYSLMIEITKNAETRRELSGDTENAFVTEAKSSAKDRRSRDCLIHAAFRKSPILRGMPFPPQASGTDDGFESFRRSLHSVTEG